jgi:hypothetical protein
MPQDFRLAAMLDAVIHCQAIGYADGAYIYSRLAARLVLDLAGR